MPTMGKHMHQRPVTPLSGHLAEETGQDGESRTSSGTSPPPPQKKAKFDDNHAANDDDARCSPLLPVNPCGNDVSKEVCSSVGSWKNSDGDARNIQKQHDNDSIVPHDNHTAASSVTSLSSSPRSNYSIVAAQQKLRAQQNAAFLEGRKQKKQAEAAKREERIAEAAQQYAAFLERKLKNLNNESVENVQQQHDNDSIVPHDNHTAASSVTSLSSSPRSNYSIVAAQQKLRAQQNAAFLEGRKQKRKQKKQAEAAKREERIAEAAQQYAAFLERKKEEQPAEFECKKKEQPAKFEWKKKKLAAMETNKTDKLTEFLRELIQNSSAATTSGSFRARGITKHAPSTYQQEILNNLVEFVDSGNGLDKTMILDLVDPVNGEIMNARDVAFHLTTHILEGVFKHDETLYKYLLCRISQIKVSSRTIVFELGLGMQSFQM